MVACLLLCRCGDAAPESVKPRGPDSAPNDAHPAFHAQPGFDRMPKPKPGDWLEQHAETGQSMGEFERSDRVVPTEQRGVVFILPIGPFGAELVPPMDVLAEYVQTFAGLPVQVLPALGDDAIRGVARRMHGGVEQLLSADLLEVLRAKLPPSAFGLLGVTTSDLYPAASWNYVFGEARFTERVGVYSFARYDPKFHGQLRGPDARRLVLERSLKVMTHELGHMFGLAHCIAYRCLMNGSNSLPETDASPLHLCPVCLRKLQSAVGFEPVARYAALEVFYAKHGLDDAADWVAERRHYAKR